MTLLQSQGSTTETVDVLLLRGLLGPAGHMAWTGVAGGALFAAAESGWARRKVLSSSAPSSSRWACTPTSLIGTGVISLVALGWTVHRVAAVHRTERPWQAGRHLPHGVRA